MVAGAGRVLVVDDDPDLVQFLTTLLVRRLGVVVTGAADATTALTVLDTAEPDLVLADIEMPGMSGLDLLAEIRARAPWLPVVIMTAHVSVDYAVTALRAQADEFLTKPFDTAQVIEVVARLIEAGRLRREHSSRQVVLAVGAHPDDVEIGVGGVLGAHQAAGDAIVILTLSRGARGGDADLRQHESLAAAELLGARLFLKDLTDTEIDGGGPTVRLIEEVVREVAPTVVYTHTRRDRHQDHRAVHEATVVAARGVATLGCYQSPSSTIEFRPNRFVAIDRYLDTKLALIDCFATQTETRTYLDHEFVTTTAKYWSRFGEGSYVEPLEILRDARGLVNVTERTEVER